MNQLMLKNT